jgi:hypothetical protein
MILPWSVRPSLFPALAFLLSGLFFLTSPVPAQTSSPTVATVGFSLDFPQSIPDHYALTVSSDGHATYDSTGKLTVDSDPGDPFHLDFTISPGTRERIFNLAAKAKYFEGKVDSGKRNIASTGDKTLTYKDGTRSTKAAYNYSPVPAVQELTALFQNLSTTLEFGRRLDYYYRYQKLALEEELKRMEQMVKDKSLEEVQAVAPILQRIMNDQSVINVTRARAQRLLNGGGVAASR